MDGEMKAESASKYTQKKAKKRQSKKRRKLLSGVLDTVHTDKPQGNGHAASSMVGDAGPADDADGSGRADGDHAAGRSPGRGSSHSAGASADSTSSGGGSGTHIPPPPPLCPAEAFAWMIHPLTPEQFFSEYWEKKPLLIRRKKRRFYTNLFTSDDADTVLREHYVKFGVNLDCTSYIDGERETHNLPGRAHRGTVWGMYDEGCSVRMLNPQTFHPPLHRLTYALQEYFGCMVGANTYLTPPGTQGFSPHYDDIEAFILQTEGSKRWRLYENPEGERLPRFSSRNFSQSDIGGAIMEVTLTAGDLLYFPRGVVHQANALPDQHSLHVTVSTYQLNHWGKYLEKVVVGALETACHEDPEFREGLPLRYTDYMGVAYEDKGNPAKRAEFAGTVKRMLGKLVEMAPVDAAADQMASECVHSSMPPILPPDEFPLSSRGRVAPRQLDITGACDARVVSQRAGRLVLEDGVANVYHTIDNAKWYQGEPPQFISFTLDDAPGIEYLLASYPEWKPVCTIPGLDTAGQIELAQHLYDVGILLVKEADDSDDDEGA